VDWLMQMAAEVVVTAVASAEEGLERLGSDSFDAVMSDELLPGGKPGSAFLPLVAARPGPRIAAVWECQPGQYEVLWPTWAHARVTGWEPKPVVRAIRSALRMRRACQAAWAGP
jgi:hypothetical protein